MHTTSPLVRRSGWALVGGSLALHFLTVVAFARQPDVLAAYTVMPIWVWGGVGILMSALAFLFLRAPLSLVVTGIWAFTVLLGADEARVIANIGKPKPQPGTAKPVAGKQPIRVITLNCAEFRFGDPSDDLAKWDPDIVILQEAHTNQIKLISEKLYGGSGDFRGYSANGVATRWKITREVRNPHRDFRFFNHNVTIQTPDHGPIEISNIHLSSAATDLRLWSPDCWKSHRANRRQRFTEINVALSILEKTTPNRPVILAGDFNAPPSDPIKLQLRRDFDDVFALVGTGWANTFQRRIPILRLDQIHATRHFTPVGCCTSTTRHSDHRMVVADLLLD